MSTSTTYPFTTAGNYTASDSGLVEVTGGSGTLKDVAPANGLFGASYTSGADAIQFATWTSETGTLTNATVSGGKLVCTGGTLKYVSYTPANLTDASTTGAIKLKYTPAYSGTPAGDRYLFCINESVGTNHSRLGLLHEVTTGDIVIILTSGAGTNVLNFVTLVSGWSPTSGTEYEFYLEWNHASEVRLWIDGVHQATQTHGSFTRGTEVNLLIGTDRGATVVADGSFDDVILYNTNAINADTNYTAGYSSPATQYSTTSPSLLTNTTVLGRPLTFTSTEVTAGSDLVKYAFRYGGQDYYWDGSAWATSSGYAQSNLASELTEQVMRELNPVANTLQIKVYLYSADGTTTPTIDSMTLTYDARDTEATEPTLVYIEGYVYGAAAPISSQAVEIRAAEGFSTEEIFIAREWYTIGTTDSNGYFNGYVFPSVTTNDYELRIGTNRYNTTIPNVGATTLSDLTLTRIT